MSVAASSGLMRPRSFRGRRYRGYTPTLVPAGSSAAASVYQHRPDRGNQMPSRRRDVSKALDSRLPTGGRLSGIDSQEVVIVAGTLRNGPRLNILNNDGQPHPAENISAIVVLVAGLISFVLGLVVRNAHTGPAVHIIATGLGLAACLVGLYLQMVSSTRNQRVVIVTGIIAGFVGLAIGLSRGGFV